MSSPSKLIKNNPYIATHDSTFHCDDVTACYMLKQLDRFKNHEIVRTRVPEILERAEIIVDVGGVLDVDKLRLDHHQRSFNQTIKDYHPNLRTTNPTKPPRLSSAGLVYAVFGKDLIIKLLNIENIYEKLDESEKKMIDAIYEKVYVEMMEEIDAIDNGVNIVSGDNVVYNYHINSGISSRVGRMNPNNSNAPDDERLERFKSAMELVGAELSEGVKFLAEVWWPRRQYFRECVLTREKVDPSGHIVFIEGDQVGWKSAFYDLEEELGIVGQLKFVIYHQPAAVESPWRVTTVPVSLKSFESRVPLKEEWRGKRGEELQQVSGISSATFVHMSGFTGGAESKEGVIRMIHKTLGSE